VLRPEDNPYNAGNRKVDYPLLSNDQNNNNNQFNSNQNQNQYSQNQNRNFQGQQQQFNQAQAQAQRQLPPSSSGGKCLIPLSFNQIDFLIFPLNQGLIE